MVVLLTVIFSNVHIRLSEVQPLTLHHGEKVQGGGRVKKSEIRRGQQS